MKDSSIAPIKKRTAISLSLRPLANSIRSDGIPITGRLTQFNLPLLKDPSAINVDKYGSGWLFEISGEGSDLLTTEEYLEHLAAVWEVTQRTIKGQLNK